MSDFSRVAVVRCPDYRPETVREAVARLVGLCGLEPIDEPLLFKPNMLSARDPGDAVTTHPAVVDAACRSLARAGALIGDSPANSRKPVEEYWGSCGYRQVSDKTGVPLRKLSRARVVPLAVSGRSVDVPVAEEFFSHRLVNLPKLKSHGLTVLTGPVKNLYGLVPGYAKSALHAKFLSAGDFSALLAALCLALRERVFFNLVDAVTVMEGNGPANGTPRAAGFLLGGRDIVACEIACAEMLGLDPGRLPVPRALRAAGLTWPEAERVGDRLAPMAGFRLPAGQGLVGFLSSPWLGPAGRFLGRRFRLVPEIDRAVCRRCGLCRDVCPRAAIGEEIVIDRNRCIDCLCCFEVCPHRAVRIRRNFLARLVR